MATNSKTKSKTNGKAKAKSTQSESTGLYTAGLVLGIIGVVFAFIPLMYWIGYILGGLAVIFGIIGLVKKAEGPKPLVATILGAVALVISLIYNIITINAVNSLVDSWTGEVTNSLSNFLDEYDNEALGKTADVTINGYVDYDGLLANKALSVTIKNISDKTLSFSVSVEAVDENGNRIDESSLYAESLAPGQSVTKYAFEYSSLDEKTLEDSTFKIYRVTSY